MASAECVVLLSFFVISCEGARARRWLRNFSDIQKLVQFTTATKVNFSESYLPAVPEELRNFKQLKTLNLSDTSIKEIPDWFSELTSLETLYISYNKIKEFPQVLTNMPNLKEIETYKCLFMENTATIPACFDTQSLPYHITRK